MATPKRRRIIGTPGRIHTFAHHVRTAAARARYGASLQRPAWQLADDEAERFSVGSAAKRLHATC